MSAETALAAAPLIDEVVHDAADTELLNVVICPPMQLLPPAPGLCPECAVDHPPHHPHNRDSMYYAFVFEAKHGRAPTWSDAMAHCEVGLQVSVRAILRSVIQRHGLTVPPDLAPDLDPVVAKGGAS